MGPTTGTILSPARAFVALSVAVAAVATPARAAGVPIVRDAEIEALVSDYATPILKAAGLNSRGVRIVLVNSPSFNAFVDGRRIFINTGTIMQAETPNEVIGVIAHESGHLAGSHQERLRAQLARARTMAVISALLGMGASVAGAATGSGSAAGAGAGVAMGGAEVAMRSLLAYQRTEEMTADRLAVNYLNATGQSTKGMLDTFQRFATALSLSGTQIDQYRISHPLPRERIANLEELARKSPYFAKADSPALQLRHDMARAKIAAYSEDLGALQRMFRKNPSGPAARYGNAIAAFLNGAPKNALPKFDALIRSEPGNPYFQEMRGEVLLKANDAAGAARAFEKAVALDRRKSPLLRMNHGRALMLTGAKANMPAAIREIKAGVAADPDFPGGYGYLAQAYAQAGDMARSDLATADMKFYSGDLQQAQIFAIRAQKQLKPGTPEWLRAQDVIAAKPPKK